MKRIPVAAGVLGAALLAAGGYGLYQLGLTRGLREAPASSAAPAPAPTTSALPQTLAEGQAATRRHLDAGLKAGDVDPVTGRKILHYHDPMLPGTKSDRPGMSPMNMLMVPFYAGNDGDEGHVAISPRVQQNLGLRTAPVVEGTLSPQVSAVGSIAFNERDQAVVQARAMGFVERLFVRATLDPVRQGQPLVALYVPDWIAAQEEFLSLRRMHGTDLAPLIDGARQRMRQAGMTDAQIRLVETSGQTQPRITLTAPVGGVVVELTAREGTTVTPGATLMRINGLRTVWANAEIPESQAALLRPGTAVQAHSPAVPGTVFDGRVQAILPEVNAATRTIKARMELANPGGRLAPGMVVTMNFTEPHPRKMLLVPSEAVIQTGRRAVVMLAEDGGRFRPVEVQTGLESGGRTEIRHGLQAGQRVVVSSQFLIDSEASLRGLEAKLNEASSPVPTTSDAAATMRHHGQGKIEAIGHGMVTLSHGPIATLQWPAMTMEFKALPQGLPPGLAVGDQVDFEFTMAAGGSAQLTRVHKTTQPSAASGSRP